MCYDRTTEKCNPSSINCNPFNTGFSNINFENKDRDLSGRF